MKAKPAVEVHGHLVTVDGNELLFDRRPIVAGEDAKEAGGFQLRGRSIRPIGKPTIEGFQEAIALACEFHESSPYWIGGLVAYGEDRADWADKLSQAMAVTKLARQTLYNLGYLYRHSTERTRAIAPSPGHLDAVAKMPEAEQAEWLTKARDEEMQVRELRLSVRSARRRLIVEGRAVLEGMYRILLVDCPWDYRDFGRGKGTSPKGHFPGMSIEDLCRMPVPEHCEENAVMGFWVTSPMLMDDPGPRDVITAWGFTYKAEIVWHKVLGNPGHYATQVEHEHFLICTRGSCLPDVPLPHDHSVFTERRSQQHSEKPEYFRQFLEKHWTVGRRVELFASERHEGWTAFGNDARLWAKEAKVAV